MKLEGMSGPALLDLFNKLVVLDTNRKVKSFKSRDAARRRITTLLLKKDKHEDDIEDLLNGLNKAAAKTTNKRNKSDFPPEMKITILKTEKPRGRITKTWKRFLELTSLETKTVGSFLKVVGNKVGQGDLKYWKKNGRIKIE